MCEEKTNLFNHSPVVLSTLVCEGVKSNSEGFYTATSIKRKLLEVHLWEKNGTNLT